MSRFLSFPSTFNSKTEGDNDHIQSGLASRSKDKVRKGENWTNKKKIPLIPYKRKY